MRKRFGSWKKVVGIMTALTLTLGMTNMSVFAGEDQGEDQGDVQETEVPDPLNGFVEIYPGQHGGVLLYYEDDGNEGAVLSEDNTFEMGDINNTKENAGYALDISGNGSDATVIAGSVTNTGSSAGDEMTSVNVYNEGGEFNLTTGAVKADNDDMMWVAGVYAVGQNGNSTNMEIKGDVDGVGGKGATGIYIVQNGEGETNITVKDGDVTGKASVDASGASIWAIGGGKASLVVEGGNIESNIFGLVLRADDAEGTEINVVADGTVKGGVYAAGGTADNINLTVWKIEPSVKGAYISNDPTDFVDEGNLMAAPDESNLGGAANGNLGATTPAGNNLANVYYIIKVEQPKEGGKLTATKADGSALNKSEGYDTAKSGEKVYLKVDLKDGYEILGAFNGEGQEEKLLKDADGNYYVEVTQAGGVYLSVKLDKKAEDKEIVDDDDTDEEVTPGTTDKETTDTGSKEAPASKNLADSPKTGDETNVMLMVILMSLSLAGAVSVIGMKRRQRR